MAVGVGVHVRASTCVCVCACVWCRVAAPHGVTPSIFELGVVSFNAITLVVTIRVALETHWHHWIFQILLTLSVLSLVPFFYLFDWFDANGMRGGVGRVYGSGSCIMVFILVAFTTQLRIVFWKLYKRCVGWVFFFCVVCWLVGWLVGWWGMLVLVGWLVGWVGGWVLLLLLACCCCCCRPPVHPPPGMEPGWRLQLLVRHRCAGT